MKLVSFFIALASFSLINAAPQSESLSPSPTPTSSPAPTGSPSSSDQSSVSATATSSSASAAPTSGGENSTCIGNVTYIESSGPQTNNISFGENYAVLFLDYNQGIVDNVRSTCEGESFINSSRIWSDAVHDLNPRPLIMYSRLYLSDQRYEIAPLAYGFGSVVDGTNFTDGSNASQIIPEVQPNQTDYVFKKVRYGAFDYNDALLVLRSQNITSVVVSGIRISGVLLASVYQLFDNNFNVFVISNNTVEPGNGSMIKQATLGPDGILPKLPANVISIEQALQAIGSNSTF